MRFLDLTNLYRLTSQVLMIKRIGILITLCTGLAISNNNLWTKFSLTERRGVSPTNIDESVRRISKIKRDRRRTFLNNSRITRADGDKLRCNRTVPDKGQTGPGSAPPQNQARMGPSEETREHSSMRNAWKRLIPILFPPGA